MSERHPNPLLSAAQACTGDRWPGMWEARGRLHLAGKCACARNPDAVGLVSDWLDNMLTGGLHDESVRPAAAAVVARLQRVLAGEE